MHSMYRRIRMYIFMIIFLVFTLGITMVSKNNEKYSNFFSFIVLIFLTIMIGFRYDVGTDYKEYERWFYIWYDNISYKEPIWGYLVYFLNQIGVEFYILTLIMAFLTNVFIYASLIKRNINGIYLVLGIIIFSSSFLFISANIMRQGLAIAIFLYCSKFITERKFLKYFFFIIIASGFHISAILLLPLYFFKGITMSFKKFFLLVVISYILIVSPILPTLLSIITTNLPYFNKYANSTFIINNEINLLAIGVLLKVCIGFLLFITAPSRFLNDNKLLTNFYAIGIIFNILSLYSFLIGRIGIYFQIFEIILIPLFLKNLENKKLKILIFYMMLIIMMLFIFDTITSDENLKYKSIFNKS